MKILLRYFILFLSLVGPASAADNAFVGTWKSDPEKGNASGGERVYAKTARGYRSTGGIAPLDFTLDGREHATRDGFTVSWKPVDERTWTSETKLDGKVTQKDLHQLSGDGRTLTETYTFVNPDGSEDVTNVTRARVSSGTGFLGRWKTVKVDFAPTITTITVPTAGTMRIETPSRQEVIDGPTNGTPFPMTGPTIPAGWFATLKQTDARTLHWTGGLAGKAMIRGTNVVSADGRTLTSTYGFVSTPAAKYIEVSQRQ